MVPVPTPEPVAGGVRNALLRRVDWRFLLRHPEVPRTLDLSPRRWSEAVRLISEPAPEAPRSADLAVLGYPRRAALVAAREALREGGEVVCLWRLPLPGGVQRARSRLERAGFSDVRLYWPGPVPERTLEFWLPLDSPAAADYVLAGRPPRSRAKAALRPLWRACARAGMLAPLCAVARAPGADGAAGAGGEIERLLPHRPSWVLLTGGRRSINKVVGLPFLDGRAEPPLAVKFARLPEADEAIGREAEVLRLLEDERPGLDGVPRLRADARRAGRRALVETMVAGRLLLDELTVANFGDHAERVTRWLVELAGSGSRQPPSRWWPRLVGRPLEEFERAFGGVLAPMGVERARRLLEGLGELPEVCEHRDCSPWNIVLAASGGPALLDWESAEPRGLPGTDLVYFLTKSAFLLDGAYESGRTREAYARLLDPATPTGRVAAACTADYCRALDLDPQTFARLRLQCWIVRCVWNHRRAEIEAGAPPDPRDVYYLGLVEEELSRAVAADR